jgi:predicted dehydrogenase
MIKKKEYKSAIIGLGNIAFGYENDPKRKGIVTHADAYSQHPKIQLVAGFDPDLNARKNFQKKYPEVEQYSQIDQLFKKSKPDIVSICSPTPYHLEHMELCLKYGVKAIWCEKPLGLDLKKAKKLVQKVKKSKTVVLLNYSRRFDKTHQKIAKDIQKVRFGRLISVDAYYSGDFVSQASHMVDTLLWMTGPIGKGPSIHFHAINSAEYHIYEIDFYFEQARLRLSNHGFTTEFYKKSPSSYFSGYGALKKTKSPYPAGYQNVMENALNNLLLSIKGSQKPFCTLDDGLKVMSVMATLQKSVR